MNEIYAKYYSPVAKTSQFRFRKQAVQKLLALELEFSMITLLYNILNRVK